MNDKDIEKLIGRMEKVFPTRKDHEELKSDVNLLQEDMQFIKEDLHSFKQETRSSLISIEKDLKSVVRVHNLDEEMTMVYDRLKAVEQKVGIAL
jgi:predicted  nucleic acid-binding Zn-ribbon protein